MQLLSALHLTNRSARPIMMLAAMLVAVAGVFAFATQAHAATVLNRFQRSCNFGFCSAFVQTNPPYQASIGSVCVTNSYTGENGTYYLPAGYKC